MSPEIGEFANATIDYLAPSDDPAAGQPLAIRISSTTQQPNFDDVRLDAICLDPGGCDADADGVRDGVDNCTLVANDDQRDTNGDGIGNLCDADLDNNCTVNFSDLGVMKSVFFTSDPDADLDGTGSVNFGDLAAMKAAFFGVPGPSGIPNACSSILRTGSAAQSTVTRR